MHMDEDIDNISKAIVNELQKKDRVCLHPNLMLSLIFLVGLFKVPIPLGVVGKHKLAQAILFQTAFVTTYQRRGYIIQSYQFPFTSVQPKAQAKQAICKSS